MICLGTNFYARTAPLHLARRFSSATPKSPSRLPTELPVHVGRRTHAPLAPGESMAGTKDIFGCASRFVTAHPPSFAPHSDKVDQMPANSWWRELLVFGALHPVADDRLF